MAANNLGWIFDEDQLSLFGIFASKVRFVASNVKVRGQVTNILETLFWHIHRTFSSDIIFYDILSWGVKGGFHMIATIAAMVAIATEKVEGPYDYRFP